MASSSIAYSQRVPIKNDTTYTASNKQEICKSITHLKEENEARKLTPVAMDLRTESEIIREKRERCEMLRRIIEHSMGDMPCNLNASLDVTTAVRKKRENELTKLNRDENGVVVYKTHINLSAKKRKKTQRNKQGNRIAMRILHSNNTGMSDERLTQITRKIQKRYMRARKNMCGHCKSHGVVRIDSTVKLADDDKEHSLQMFLFDTAHIPQERLVTAPTRLLS